VNEVRITFTENGSIRIDGPAQAFDHDGTPVELREGKPTYFCRCGRSANKPFCDGSHKTTGFRGALVPRE